MSNSLSESFDRPLLNYVPLQLKTNLAGPLLAWLQLHERARLIHIQEVTVVTSSAIGNIVCIPSKRANASNTSTTSSSVLTCKVRVLPSTT